MPLAGAAPEPGLWGYDLYGETHTVDVHVAHLRKRLAGSSVEIETVLGVGYKLVAGGRYLNSKEGKI